MFLRGEIPPELGAFDRLEYLDLSGNHLTGEIPPELGDLPDLGYLDLSANWLTGLVPMKLGKYPQLWSVDLSSNQLVGPIPVGLPLAPRERTDGQDPGTTRQPCVSAGSTPQRQQPAGLHSLGTWQPCQPDESVPWYQPTDRVHPVRTRPSSGSPAPRARNSRTSDPALRPDLTSSTICSLYSGGYRPPLPAMTHLLGWPKGKGIRHSRASPKKERWRNEAEAGLSHEDGENNESNSKTTP